MKQHKQRIYIDTSVAGGYFDNEFSTDSKKFFALVKKGEVIVIISSLLESELIPAPENVRELIEHLPSIHLEKVEQTEEATQLAENYIKEKVVGKTSFADCPGSPSEGWSAIHAMSELLFLHVYLRDTSPARNKTRRKRRC